MYPPQEGGAGQLPKDLLTDLGPANPPFNIRDTKIVAEELGSDPLPHGFTAIPVMTFDRYNINDIRTGNCPFINDEFNRNYLDSGTGEDPFAEHLSKLEPIRKPLGIALKLPEESVQKASVK